MKGIIHAHSEYSYDAKESLASLKAKFIAQGLGFACMTEHTDGLTPERAEAYISACRDLSDASFVLIPGFEMPYLGTHILLVGAGTFPFREHDLRGSLADFVRGGAFAIIAHPHRNRFQSDDVMLAQCGGVEVWNSQYDGKRYPRPAALTMFRSLQKHKPGLLAFAGLDLHRLSHLGGPHLELGGSPADADGILSALRDGRYAVVGHQMRISPSGAVQGPAGWPHRALMSRSALGVARFASSAARLLGLHRIVGFGMLRERIRRHF